MRIFDVSLPITSSLPVWPGDPRVVLWRTMSLESGDLANVSHMSCCVHAGTHIDAPCHFIEGGAAVDEIPLKILVGPAYLGSLPDVKEISPSDLEELRLPKDTERLLLRTRNSKLWAEGATEFTPDYVALTPESANWVVEKGIKLLGVDYLSVQRFHDAEPTTHRTLLGAGVVIVEGLNLFEVTPGLYQLVCLPLKLVGSDGAPARVLLLDE